jgi:hypothetical protein
MLRTLLREILGIELRVLSWRVTDKAKQLADES